MRKPILEQSLVITYCMMHCMATCREERKACSAPESTKDTSPKTQGINLTKQR